IVNFQAPSPALFSVAWLLDVSYRQHNLIQKEFLASIARSIAEQLFPSYISHSLCLSVVPSDCKSQFYNHASTDSESSVNSEQCESHYQSRLFHSKEHYNPL